MIKFKTSLLPYQQEAYDKLSKLKIGALYMEMGTGKTRTALSLVSHRLDQDKVNAILWLCPCSVKKNLASDIIYHCGDIPNNLVIKGIESISQSDRLYIKLLELVNNFDVYLIVDESNLVKNPYAIRSSRILNLSEKCKYKLILNGTPVSKNEADLFEQWYILDWRVLGYRSYWSFAANHLEYYTVKLPTGREIKTDQIRRVLDVDYLIDKISPYTFQIKKSECLSLPEKYYKTYRFDLDHEEHNNYWDIKNKYLFEIDNLKPETVYKYFTALQHVTSGRKVITGPDERMRCGNVYANPLSNPRIDCLKSLISELHTEKAIIFAKYVDEIDDIIVLLNSMHVSYCEFTGRVKLKDRQKSIDDFSCNKQVLLANKMCGAYGLNLQFCHNVIFYDNDFDFATRAQAEDRVHRLGQKDDVYIYDIVANNTIDEFILDNLLHKGNLVSSFKEYLRKEKERAKNLSKQKRLRGRTGKN